MSVVEKLYRELPQFKIDIVDWQIPDQGITVLWGESGSGKTTILRALLGLDPKADVRWRWGDELLSSQKISQRNLGVVFQDLALFPHLSVEKNILFPVQKDKHPNWQKDFDRLIEVMSLEPHLKKKVGDISGGEKQRVALARSLIYRPRMLLLDEPFSSLDGQLKSSLRTLLKDVSQELQCPLLLVTHDEKDVEILANHVTTIKLGKIVKEN